MEASTINLEDYIGMAKAAIYRITGCGTRHIDFDDMKQEALMAVLRASRTFKPEIGDFKNYAAICAGNSVRDFWRHRGRRLAPSIDDFPETAVESSPPSQGEIDEAWASISRQGTECEVKLATLIFRDGMRHVDAARLMGMNRAVVTKRIGNLFLKVRMEMNMNTGTSVDISSTTLSEATT